MRYLTALLAVCLSVASFAFDVPCLDPLACNFMEEGECFFTDENGEPCVIEGCTIEGACNYNPEADIYDGSCEFVSCLGCTDSEACNYDETALYDDASCIYYVDCNGTCGGDWIEDACGNCYVPIPAFYIEFTTCSATGPLGPSQEMCDEFYDGNEEVTVTDGIQEWVIPHSGTYRLEAAGAAGNDGQNFAGYGALMSGDFELNEGDTLFIMIGQTPLNSSDEDGAGGGGTFVVSSSNTPLIIAGGGGGGTSQFPGNNEIANGRAQTSGGPSQSGHPGGENGNGAPYATDNLSQSCAGQGAGFYTDAGATECGGLYEVAKCFLNGGQGGAGSCGNSPFGGFGGGGGTGCSGAGGGGGYSGGGGSWASSGGYGGGGGSLNLGENQENIAGWNVGNGYVIISLDNVIPVCNPGCTHPQACNYNPESNFDDGSCDYCFCGEGTQWVDSLQACMVTEAALMQACGEGTYWDDLAQACLTIETCQEDLDGDGVIGVNDLLELLSSFGTECVPEPESSEWTCGDPVNYHGYDYSTVLIGGQCWFAENLRTEYFQNGDSIPGEIEEDEWEYQLYGPATAIYGELGYCTHLSPTFDACNSDLALEEYGRLYNGFAVLDDRELCPVGFHIPSDNEFMELEAFIGIPQDSLELWDGLRGQVAPLLKSTTGWYEGENGSNSIGFNAVPADMRYCPGNYQGAGRYARFWTSTTQMWGQWGGNIWGRMIFWNEVGVYRSPVGECQGMSVRCIQDSE